ncbi:hypothetical protein QVD17_40406 [Tagetes erecta]|uniref:Uncharacterized protein n=1 Tax=Tagetes erecta TaxID=13708 RepID=A0AAD8NHT9_TARER|nr:hypothetical protein QVD17_40406 [Tagetes erecta]
MNYVLNKISSFIVLSFDFAVIAGLHITVKCYGILVLDTLVLISLATDVGYFRRSQDSIPRTEDNGSTLILHQLQFHVIVEKLLFCLIYYVCERLYIAKFVSAFATHTGVHPATDISQPVILTLL